MKFKVGNISLSLSKKYGGNWKYIKSQGIWRDELNKRSAWYTISFYEDETSFYKDMYIYYDNNKQPTERVFL